MTQQSKPPASKFDGFCIPNTTPVPDIVFDDLLEKLTGNELKVLLYIIRRTYGFGKNADAISLSQFREGIITQDGKILDKGCGIKHNRTILVALESLEKSGYIASKKRQTKSGDSDTTIYSLRFKTASSESPDSGVVTSSNHVVISSNDGRYLKSPPSLPQVTTVVTSGNTQETVIQETVKQQTVIQEESVTPVVETPQDETSVSSTHALSDSHENAVPTKTKPAKPTRKASPKAPATEKTPEQALSEESELVQQIVKEWVGIFTKKPTPVTEAMIVSARKLEPYKPEPGEIAACRLWMYATDQNGWYAKRGMHLKDVLTKFEQFRSLASIPEQKPVLQLVPTQEASKQSKKLLTPNELKSMSMSGW